MGCYPGVKCFIPTMKADNGCWPVGRWPTQDSSHTLLSSSLIYCFAFCLKPAESSLVSESESSSLNGLWMGGGIARDILEVLYTRSTKPGPEALWAWLGPGASCCCSLAPHPQQLLLVDTPHSITPCFCAGDRLHCQTRFTDWTCECILAGCFGQQVNPGLPLAESDVRGCRAVLGSRLPPPPSLGKTRSAQSCPHRRPSQLLGSDHMTKSFVYNLIQIHCHVVMTKQ